MRYDLFVSYSRQDNKQGRITELVDQIKEDFKIFDETDRTLNVCFDTSVINCMDDWRHKILQGLRESHLMLVCLSPTYLESDYCEWEFNEYLNHEISRSFVGEGVAPVYFVEVPGWGDKDFEKKCADWIKELRRRQHIDLRPWFHEGRKSLHNLAIKERMDELKEQLKSRIKQNELRENRLGNIDSHSPHFIGRVTEMRTLVESLKYGRSGTLTIIHGLGGVGKTTLAVGYANIFADHYGGGCWQLRCEGKESLPMAIAELAGALGLHFNEAQKKDTNLQYERVMAELRQLARANEPERCLILLDNVDQPKLIEPSQTKRFAAEEWLQIIVTTRLGKDKLHGTQHDRVFISVDELPEEDAILLIESYQPGSIFKNDKERSAALKISQFLGGFTLAVESVAVFLGRFSDDVSCSDLFQRLQKEGFGKWDKATGEINEGIRHGEKSMMATLKPTIEQLSDPAKAVLSFSAMLPADNIPLSWLRSLIIETFPEYGIDPEPGYPDKWGRLRDQLIGLRILQLTTISKQDTENLIVKMHRIVRDVLPDCLAENDDVKLSKTFKLDGFLYQKVCEFRDDPELLHKGLELNSLYQASKLVLGNKSYFSPQIAAQCSSSLYNAGLYSKSLELSEAILETSHSFKANQQVPSIWCHNIAGASALSLYLSDQAESHFLKAQDLLKDSDESENQQLVTLSNLSCCYRESFQPERALDLSTQALALAEKMYAPQSDQVALHCVNLGLVYQDLSELEKAISLLKRAVEIDRLDTKFSINICQDISSLAEALRNKGLADESQLLSEEAIELVSNNGVDSHPVVITLKMNLARIYEDKGEIEKSRELLEAAFEISKLNFGEDSVQTADVFNNLGINSLVSGSYKQAVNIFEHALKIEKSAKSVRPIKLVHRQLNLGITLLFDQKVEEATEQITSAWNELMATNQLHILAVRLLITRLIIAEISVENSDIFIGQLYTLLREKRLTSPGVDIRWALEDLLKTFVSEKCTKFYDQLELYFRFINAKFFGDNFEEKPNSESITLIPLSEKWP